MQEDKFRLKSFIAEIVFVLFSLQMGPFNSILMAQYDWIVDVSIAIYFLCSQGPSSCKTDTKTIKLT